MTKREITPEDIEEWAAENDYSEDDLANFAAAFQVGQLLLSHLVPDAKQYYADDIDEAHQALYRASSLDPEDGDLPEPLGQYVPEMAFDPYDIRDGRDGDDAERLASRVRVASRALSDAVEDCQDADVPVSVEDDLLEAGSMIEDVEYTVTER